MPPDQSVPSLEEWRKYERRSMAKQQEFIERYKDDFEKVPVTNSDTIKAGDHLVLERKYYDHHMLCTSVRGDNQVVVIHYSGPALGISRAVRSISFKDVGVKAEVEEKRFHSRNLWNNRLVLKVKLFNTKIAQSAALLPLRSWRSFYRCCSVQRFSKSRDQSPTRAWRRNEIKTASNWFSKTVSLGCLDLIKVLIRFWQRTLNLKFRSITVHIRGRYSWEFLVGVCRRVLQILTRFQTKKCNFSHPFSDQTSKIHTRFQTWPLGRNYVIIT